MPDICTESTGVKYLYRIYKGLDLDFHSFRHHKCGSGSSCEICRIFTPSKEEDGGCWLSAPQLAQWITKRCQTVGTNPRGPAVPTSWPKALTALVTNTTSGNWTHSYHRTRSQLACVHYLLTVLLQIWRCNSYYLLELGRRQELWIPGSWQHWIYCHRKSLISCAQDTPVFSLNEHSSKLTFMFHIFSDLSAIFTDQTLGQGLSCVFSSPEWVTGFHFQFLFKYTDNEQNSWEDCFCLFPSFEVSLKPSLCPS